MMRWLRSMFVGPQPCLICGEPTTKTAPIQTPMKFVYQCAECSALEAEDEEAGRAWTY